MCIIARGEKVLDGAVAEREGEHGGAQRRARRSTATRDNGIGDGARATARSSTRVDDQNRFFEIELAPGADPQMLLRGSSTTGAPIKRFELVQPSLHQIFLETVGATGVEEGMTGHG